MKQFLNLDIGRVRGVRDLLTLNNSYGFWIILFYIILILSPGLAAAGITTDVDPVKVQLGEPFRLTITMDDAQSEGVPDLTILQKDFTISSTERSSSYTIVNGQAHSVSQWSVLLLPKKTGVLTIPSIQIGKQQSDVTTIEVTGASTSTGSNQANNLDNQVMLKTDISQEKPFVNQQVIYTVRLYNSQRLLDAEYQPPRVENALLIPLGDGRRYQTFEEGKNYHVEEQRYAVFPQKSGELELIPPTFNAIIYDVVPRRVSLRGQQIKLTVKSMPSNVASNHWLPAKQINLTEEFDKNNNNFLQGSTLVRMVTLEATGVPGELLPSLNFASDKNFNVYPEKPIFNNVIKQQEIMDTMTVKVTYLLNTSGPITIPELKLPWFNTVTGKEEIASLPARSIDVEPKQTSIDSQPVPSKESSQVGNNLTQEAQMQPLQSEQKSSFWVWFLAGGFALAWLITIVLWLFSTGKLSRGDKRSALKDLKNACAKDDPKGAQVAIMAWADLQWPDDKLLNLSDVGTRANDFQLKKQLHLLSEAIYSEEKKHSWHGNDLWRSVINYRAKKPSYTNKGNGLPPINPT